MCALTQEFSVRVQDPAALSSELDGGVRSKQISSNQSLKWRLYNQNGMWR